MCCLRVDDLGAWYRRIADSGAPGGATGIPRRHPPKIEAGAVASCISWILTALSSLSFRTGDGRASISLPGRC